MEIEKRGELLKSIALAINSVSAENESGTPDFMLAEYLVSCLENFNVIVNARSSWYK